MIKHKIPVRVELHQIINWFVTVALLVFALWIINMYVQTKSILKEDRILFEDVQKKITKTQEYLQETRIKCELDVKADIPAIEEKVLN